MGATILGLVLLGISGYFVAVKLQPAPTVALPADPASLDRPVAELAQRYAAHAQANPHDAARHATLGLVYEANSMWLEAAAAFETAAKLNPSEPLARCHLAIAQRNRGDPHAALATLRALVAEHGDVAGFQHRLGEALLEAGLAVEAAGAFQAVVDRAPSAPEGYAGLADAKLCSDDFAAAASLAERAVKLDPGFKRAHYVLGLAYRGLGRQAEAEQQLNQGLGASERYMRDAWSDRLADYMVGWSSLMDRAMDMLDAGRTADGTTLMERALTLHPNDVEAMNNLAVAYMSANQVDKARDLLKRAERLDPNAFATQINLAACHLAMKRFDDALGYADRAVALAPGKGQTHLTRGRTLRWLKRNEEALASFKQAAALDARDAQIYLEMGDACVLLDRFTEAREHYETAAPRLPTHWLLRVSLCTLYMRLDQFDRASEALRAAQSLAPNEPRVRELAAEFEMWRNR